MPELRGRESLGTFLERFRAKACLNRYDSALDSKIAVNASGTPRVELERLHGYNLVDISLKAWQALTKAVEKKSRYWKWYTKSRTTYADQTLLINIVFYL